MEWNQVVHHGEDRLLDLSRVTRPADDYQLPFQVEQYESLARRVLVIGIGPEIRAVDDGVIRLEVCEHVRVELANEHVPGKEVVPGVLADYPYLDPVLRISTGISILHEDVLVLQVRTQPVQQLFEIGWFERFVDLPPPNLVFAR